MVQMPQLTDRELVFICFHYGRINLVFNFSSYINLYFLYFIFILNGPFRDKNQCFSVFTVPPDITCILLLYLHMWGGVYDLLLNPQSRFCHCQ
jgi:hypothetical protein